MANEYKIPEHEMDELNTIIGNQGGVIPSKVSDALAAMQKAYAEDDEQEAKKQFNIAVEANKLNGAAWDNVQKWHNDMKNEYKVEDGNGGNGGGTVPPTGDVVELPGKLMGTGVNTDLMMNPGVKYTIQLGEDVDNCGFANGGRKCYAGMGGAPGKHDENYSETNDQATCTLMPRGGNGKWLTFWIDQGPAEGRYSANKYASTATQQQK